MMVTATPTPDQLSNIAGSMSIACWLVVYTPQIWENYQLKSGDGLSVGFVVLWLMGDLTGLFGAIGAKLVPPVIILAVYYTLCDILLLFQIYYYRHLRRRALARASSPSSSPTEETSLLASSEPPVQPKPLLPPSLMWIEYPLLVTFVLAAGAGAWYLSPASDDVGIPENPGRGGEVELEWSSQTLGWTSAVLYFASRVPQIAHNFKTRCAGLSLAMFFFCITGNITFTASVLVESTAPKYLIANASWLAGALTTVALDLFVLGQFAVFSWQDKKKRQEAGLFISDEPIEEEA